MENQNSQLESAEKEIKSNFIQKTLPLGKVTVFVDHRENNMVPAYIKELGAEVILKQLEVADFICSERVAVEKKTVSDFVGSIANQRIFKQAGELSDSFERPLFLVEGNPEMMFFERNMHPNVIRGVLSSIAIDYKIPIIWTANPKETANMIYWIAKREQLLEKKELQIRAKTKQASIKDQQEFLVAGLPSISNVLSRRLLEHFGSIKKVFSAKPEKLMKVEGIGEEKAKKIWDLLHKEYEKEG